MFAKKVLFGIIIIVVLLSVSINGSFAVEHSMEITHALDKASSKTSSTTTPRLSDEQIRQVLVQRIDDWHIGVGIVVGIVSPEGRRIISYGKTGQENGSTVDQKTVFEIGSITKVFTSLLLTDMIARGEVKLDDPVAKYLPSDVKVPERDGKKITLRDLAQQVSGLPRLPSNLAPKDGNNPYNDYSTEQLFQFLSNYQLTRAIGSQYEYSNLGVGLLGEALARRAGKDYASLVNERIFNVLKMSSSNINTTTDMQRRLAVGHNAKLQAVPSWTWKSQALAGAGGLRSDMDDLLNFMAAHAGLSSSPLKAAMKQMLAKPVTTGNPNLDIALGWHILKHKDGSKLVWHNGGTGGYRSFAGFNPKTKTAVVVLSNVGDEKGVDDLGRHILDTRYELMEKPQAARQPTEIKIDPKTYTSFVGNYQLDVGPIIKITQEGDALFAQQDNMPKEQIFAEDARKFFSKLQDAQISFDADINGKSPSLLVHVVQGTFPGKRVEELLASAEKASIKKESSAPITSKAFDQYVGKYQLAPSFIISLYRQDDRYFAQATNQPPFEMAAQDKTHFDLPAVNAKITINLDSSDKAISLTLHQGGANQVAKRIE
ncbi:serine hydrolase [Undibacterium seohonense]|uniref:Serine hydrolase n=1 Tax=Undibacterium seohonense TaxID=1344950 RepID=A0ABR6X5J7_9BURK|nr:serine hydrolase [Undibacterium seohonense]MBC3808146.1 serine hydrolase [Undibacterium seohonense]